MIHSLLKIIMVPFVLVSSWFSGDSKPVEIPTPTPVVEEIQLGGTTPINGTTYNLAGSGVTNSATSIVLSSFTIPQTGQRILDADVGDIFYITIEPGNRTRQEVVSCTTVTQNTTTATLSGCVRGLSPIAPHTASSTLAFAHGGGAQVIFGDAAQLFNLYTAKANDEAVTGLWSFNSYLPTSSITATTSNQFTTKAYVDSLSNQGAATSTESNGGISELGTLAEQASSFDGGADKPTVLQTKNSTSTCQVVGSYNIVASTTTGKLDKNCFDQTAMYNFTGARNNFQNASSTGLSAGYAYFGGTATSSFSNSGVLTLATTTAGILRTDSFGTVFVGEITRYSYASTSVATTTSASCANCSQTRYATTTPTNVFTIPAGVLNASSTISVKANGTCTAGAHTGGGGGSCSILLRTSTGVTLWEGTMSPLASVTANYGMNVDTFSNNSTSAQISIGTMSSYASQGISYGGGVSRINNTSSIDFTQDLSLVMVIKAEAAAGAGDTGIISSSGLSSYSIVVNP